MRSLLLAVLAAYLIAAIHSILAFVNKRRSLQRVAEWSMAVGFIIHTAVLIDDWAVDGHYPLFGQRETLSFLAWAVTGGYALVLYYYRAQALGAFAMPLVCILTSTALLVNRDPSATAAAFSKTLLFPIHTTLLVFAYAAFFIVFMASVMFLIQERELKVKTFSGFFYRLPSLSTMNEIATHAAAIGLTLLTLGLVAGVLWNWSENEKIWRNDPKEIFALLTWAVYFVLAMYRSTAGWRGRRAAWLGVLGFVLVLFTFLAAPLFGSYHVFGLALM
jgi:ABC-type transport system involved in cytochrome c biogenesis permease subunit